MSITPAYLAIAKATEYLDEDGIEVPDNLNRLLVGIESRIDEWLGWRIAPTKYTEYSVPDGSGVLYLRKTPVISVVSVSRKLHSHIDMSDEAIAAKLSDPVRYGPDDTSYALGTACSWDNKNRILLSPHSWFSFQQYYTDFFQFEVVYFAGKKEIPPIFEETVYEILIAAIDNGNRLSFLDAPTEDVQSISLPGGISESNKLSDTGAKNQLERFLMKLDRYRRTIFVRSL